MPQTENSNKLKRIILFSHPVAVKLNEVFNLMFHENLEDRVVGYMNADGAEAGKQWESNWIEWLKPYNAQMVVLDNAKVGEEAKQEAVKLQECNALLITGGNTFTLLHNLRQSGLDKAIIEFSQKDSFSIAGFSAGALVLGPSIRLAGYDGWAFGKDENTVNLTDLAGLNIIDFEIIPHYTDEDYKILEKYQKETDNEVIAIKDDEYIFIDL